MIRVSLAIHELHNIFSVCCQHFSEILANRFRVRDLLQIIKLVS